MRKILIIITICVTIPISVVPGGCSVYKIDIQQGNVIEAEKSEQLAVGMTKQQVLFIMGTPMLRDPFHEDRWDYIYTFKPGNSPAEKQTLTLYFDNSKLIRFVHKPLPTTH